MQLDYHGNLSYVRMEVKDSKMQVEFHPELSFPGPYTTGTCIHVRTPRPDFSDDEWLDWFYETYHEIGHESEENKHPYWKTVMKKYGYSPRSMVGSLSNLIDDHVQEHNRIGVYEGRNEILRKGRARFVVSKLLSKENLDNATTTMKGKVFKATAILDTKHRASWNPMLFGVWKVAWDTLPEDEKEIFDQIEGLGIDFSDLKNSEEAYFAAKAIDELFEWPEDENDDEGEGEGAEGEPCDDGEDGDDGGDDGDEGGDGDGGDAGYRSEIERYTYHIHHTKYEHREETESSYNNTFTGQHIDYDDSFTYSSVAFAPKTGHEIDLASEDYCGYTVIERHTERYENSINSLSTGSILENQVKMLFASMKQVTYEHGKRRGRVSNKNLWKATSPIYSEEIFKRKRQLLDTNTAVTILADNSGSMAGEKFVHASKAAIMLYNALNSVQIPTELLSFSEDIDGPIHSIVKKFGEVNVDESVLARRFAVTSNWMSQNSDGESIQWAALRLMRRPENRKVLVVLSDGSPAAYNGGHLDAAQYTKIIIDEVQDKSPVELYGIGIMDRNVAKFYRDYKVIATASELEDALLTVVKSKVLG